MIRFCKDAKFLSGDECEDPSHIELKWKGVKYNFGSMDYKYNYFDPMVSVRKLLGLTHEPETFSVGHKKHQLIHSEMRSSIL